MNEMTFTVCPRCNGNWTFAYRDDTECSQCQVVKTAYGVFLHVDNKFTIRWVRNEYCELFQIGRHECAIQISLLPYTVALDDLRKLMVLL